MTELSNRHLAELAPSLLLQRAVDGDSQAFRLLVQPYLPMMRAYAIRLTGNSADADDALQDSLLQAWQKLDTLQDPAQFKSWVMKLTGRKSIDLLRKRKPNADIDDYHHLSDGSASPEDLAMSRSDIDTLSQALKKLPVDQQRVWIMREYGACSYQEIAQSLGMSTPSVRGKLARARATLLEEMEGKN